MSGVVRWDGFSADPRGPEVAGVRAADRDRPLAVGTLRESSADGRLDRAEFDLRSAVALGATLLGELPPLLQDLEPPVTASRSIRDEAVRRYRKERREARDGVLVVGTITTGIWGATSLAEQDLLFFWPVFPIVLVGAGWLLTVVHRRERIEELEEKAERRRQRRGRRSGEG